MGSTSLVDRHVIHDAAEDLVTVIDAVALLWGRIQQGKCHHTLLETPGAGEPGYISPGIAPMQLAHLDRLWDEFMDAQQELASEVRKTEYLRAMKNGDDNRVLFVTNIQRKQSDHLPPEGALVTYPDRRSLAARVLRCVNALSEKISIVLPALIDSDPSTRRMAERWLAGHSDPYPLTNLIAADMAIAASQIDSDGRQSQGQSRAVLGYRWEWDSTDHWIHWGGGLSFTPYVRTVAKAWAAAAIDEWIESKFMAHDPEPRYVHTVTVDMENGLRDLQSLRDRDVKLLLLQRWITKDEARPVIDTESPSPVDHQLPARSLEALLL